MRSVGERSASYPGKRLPLLDANVHAALILHEHRGHSSAHHWLTAQAQIASCPLVELAVLRLLLRPIAAGDCGLSADRSRSVVARSRQATGMRMIADDVDAAADALPWRHVIGHNQVNDASDRFGAGPWAARLHL